MKQPFFSTILLLTVIFITSAQNSPIGLGVTFSPSWYNIQPAEGLTQSYTTGFSFRSGVDARYHLNDRLTLSTGAFLSEIAYDVDYDFTFIDPNDPLIPREGRIRALYTDIPIELSYDIISGEHFSVYTAVGGIASVLVHSGDSTTFENDQIRDSEYLESFLMSLKAGAGVRYKINEQFAVRIEPQFRYFLKYIDLMMSYHPTATDLNFGVDFRF